MRLKLTSNEFVFTRNYLLQTSVFLNRITVTSEDVTVKRIGIIVLRSYFWMPFVFCETQANLQVDTRNNSVRISHSRHYPPEVGQLHQSSPSLHRCRIAISQARDKDFSTFLVYLQSTYHSAAKLCRSPPW